MKMEILIELFWRKVIVTFLGVNIRYFVLKPFSKSISKEKLKGNNGKSIDYTQDIFNVLVGLIAFAVISFSLVYLFY